MFQGDVLNIQKLYKGIKLRRTYIKGSVILKNEKVENSHKLFLFGGLSLPTLSTQIHCNSVPRGVKKETIPRIMIHHFVNDSFVILAWQFFFPLCNLSLIKEDDKMILTELKMQVGDTLTEFGIQKMGGIWGVKSENLRTCVQADRSGEAK